MPGKNKSTDILWGRHISCVCNPILNQGREKDKAREGERVGQREGSESALSEQEEGKREGKIQTSGSVQN